MESVGKLPFLDLLIIWKDTGAVNLQIYRKPTHTDQYLNFNSHHPIEPKLCVVRTFFDRSQSLISDSTDRHAEDLHTEKALRDTGYPDWTFQKHKKQMKMKQKMDSANRRLVVLPYVESTSERIARVMISIKFLLQWDQERLKSLLVHPKDKEEEEIADCVYKIPCASCEKCYIGDWKEILY